MKTEMQKGPPPEEQPYLYNVVYCYLLEANAQTSRPGPAKAEEA